MTCKHPEWRFTDDGIEWLAGDLSAIPHTVMSRSCSECGELWFREPGTDWFQRYWTQDEIDKMHADAAEMARLLGIE